LLKAVNRVVDGNLLTIAHVAIEYGPDTPFARVWSGEAMARHFAEKDFTADQIAEKRQELQKAFDAIEI